MSDIAHDIAVYKFQLSQIQLDVNAWLVELREAHWDGADEGTIQALNDNIDKAYDEQDRLRVKITKLEASL